MPYRDRLRDGSFRGVPFATPQSEVEGGRRGVVHEYPGSDVHSTQELGLRVQRFTVTALVIGPDYDVVRNALIEALEKPGPGRLVHRYFGDFDAEVEPGKTYRITESNDQGGQALFTIPFIRAGKPNNPTLGIDAAFRVRNLAESPARPSLIQRILSIFDTSGIEQVRTDALQTLQHVTNTLTEINNRIASVLATPNQIAGQIQALSNQLVTLIGNADAHRDLFDGIAKIGAAIFNAIADIGRALKNLTFRLDSDGQGAAEAQIAARRLDGLTRSLVEDFDFGEGENDNDRAIFDFMRQTAAIEAAVTAVDLPYDSKQAADFMRDALADVLDAAAASGDDDVYLALNDIRAELNRYLSVAAGDLPVIVEHVPARTLPCLLVAHLVHGDARRSEEIIARNNIRHPVFVPGGVPLEVISDAS